MTGLSMPFAGGRAQALLPGTETVPGETTTMTMQFTARHSQQDHVRRMKSLASDGRMCRRLTALSMPFFLVSTLVQRAVRPVAGGHRLSVFAQARASANATIPFMFMG
ncbi:hypothetical protein IP69_18685 [Bosea sp. AAP35]|uniref:hypothetical protein n=1 Tax=Bosea sp. AAP35 TaxID=1523417 RepID=UPI0006B99A1E|nr:hypothetical protein [Bosea sp. AAP35]KPF64210.1 hypothetical protein IP69_18685 [Bosea sp. AAP35]